MVTESKPWDWEAVTAEGRWKTPARESHWLIDRWKSQQKKEFLDLGAGLGRHAIQFAKAGFNVSGFDLSENSIERTRKWASEEGLKIDLRIGDMLSMPYNDSSFDCILAYHVVSHTDTEGMRKIASELKRILRRDGEFYLSLGSKKAWGFQQDWPEVDENTKKRMEDGPEYGVPHFYADMGVILDIFSDFEIVSVEEKQEQYSQPVFSYTNEYGMTQGDWYFYVLGAKK
jgi:SAM-dependent methyltransferase